MTESNDLLAPLLQGEESETITDNKPPSQSKIPDALLEKAYSIVRSSNATTSDGYEDAINAAFQVMDADKSGKLERSEIQAFIQTAATHAKLNVQLGESVIEAAVDALIHDAGGGEDDFITKEQFYEIFERHPDMLIAFEDTSASLRRRELAASSRFNHEDFDEEELKENEQLWATSFIAIWKNKWASVLWIGIYITCNVVLFAFKAHAYYHNEEATNLFGQCIVVARGCAETLNLNAMLILLLMCKHFLTLLRKTPVRFAFPFDTTHELHIGIGIVFALLAVSHTCAHICDIYRFAHADEDDITALFGDRLGPPKSVGGRWAYFLSTRAGITGVLMVLCMIVAYSFAFNRRKHFNRFWYSHHLLLAMLILMCIHGTGQLLEPFETVYWLIGPLALYFIPRFWRESPLSKLEVKNIDIKAGGVVQLRLQKPKYYDCMVSAGMYGVINIPEISRLQWHPFTLTSSPSDDYIEFHFRKVGGWTQAAHDLLESKIDDKEISGIKDLPIVKVEGPIGASSQGFSDYPVVVLVGAGIGVTPMISVLNDLLHNPGKVKRCFFYWTVRDRDSFQWFTELMDRIFEADKKNLLQIRHFLTSVKYDDRDLGAVLLHHATRAHHKRTEVDLLLGQQIHHQVECGRPDWTEELDSVREEAESIGEYMVGIFLCGPNAMAKSVYDASLGISKKHSPFHMYFTKETF
jgi:NAD(P)H-flavin reductase